jgi:hypothetical protein
MSSTRLVDYLLLAIGNEDAIATKIQSVARGYMARECALPLTNRYFTKEYCEKVKSLAEATDPKDYIARVVVDDTAFLSHTTNIIPMGQPGVVAYAQSPIADYVGQFNALRAYSARPTPVGVGNAFSWIALLLLPIAIALRLTKTSLELYGGEDLPDPQSSPG